ncbi:MAG: ABC transporter permease [Gammaproteobacteria bacterium]
MSNVVPYPASVVSSAEPEALPPARGPEACVAETPPARKPPRPRRPIAAAKAPPRWREPATRGLFALIGIVLFLGLWQAMAARIDTSLGRLPGPMQVAVQVKVLSVEWQAERERAVAFRERLAEQNARRLANDPTAEPIQARYTGAPTFVSQVGTSLLTVFAGFLLATLVAVPLGILAGSSRVVQAAINPIVQLFRPVSPLAWLPIVTLVVSALYVSPDPMLAKSFVISALTVMLCCLWPTLINTTIGVASVPHELTQLTRVLRLPWLTRVRWVVLPSAVPMVFAGMRVSLGIGWMVLIATEMLAQNPGLGKFVWDEFQNGSSQSLARILVGVVTIGLLGFALDRLMLAAQRMVSWDKNAVLR